MVGRIISEILVLKGLTKTSKYSYCYQQLQFFDNMDFQLQITFRQQFSISRKHQLSGNCYRWQRCTWMRQILMTVTPGFMMVRMMNQKNKKWNWRSVWLLDSVRSEQQWSPITLTCLIKRQQVYELIINNVDAHVPTYFLSDILMLQVDSLWTALHMEGTKVPNGTCICVFKRHKLINKQKN